jgi:flagellar M-ring protein FliF
VIVGKANTPAAPPAKDGGQSSKTESATYGVNRTTRHVIEPAGRIRRLTAAVLVDDLVDRKQDRGKWVETYRKRSPEDLKLIGELAQAAIGFSSARGDVISVQNLSFDRAQIVDVPPFTLADRTRKGLTDYSSLIRYIALFSLFGLVYMLMIRPIQKRALAPSDPLLEAASSPAVSKLEGEVIPDGMAILAQRSLLLKKQLSDFVQAEPESSAVAVRAWLRDEAK